MLKLAIGLAKHGKTLNLDQAFHDAIYSHFVEIYNDNASVTELEGDWKIVIGMLVSHWQETLLRNIRDFILDKANENLTSILSLYGEFLSLSEVWLDDSDQVVRKLFVEIVNGALPEELAFMDSMLRHHPKILEKCRKPSLETLQDRVRDELSNEEVSDESHERMKQIAKVLKVRPRRKKQS